MTYQDIRTTMGKLQPLRQRIDEIDDQIHDLLKERAEIVGQVAPLKKASGLGGFAYVKREADMLQKRIDYHSGRFPIKSILRIWREFISASLHMENDLKVGMYRGTERDRMLRISLTTFGDVTPLVDYENSAKLFQDLKANKVDYGVLPIAEEGEPWWSPQRAADWKGLFAVALLPFVTFGSKPEAVLICPYPMQEEDDPWILHTITGNQNIPETAKVLGAHGNIYLILIRHSAWQAAMKAGLPNAHRLGAVPAPIRL